MGASESARIVFRCIIVPFGITPLTGVILGMSFTKDMAELQEIVSRLDSGQMPLEDALELFERGIGLVNSCKKYLEEAQQRIILLSAEQGGSEGREWDPLSRDEPSDGD